MKSIATGAGLGAAFAITFVSSLVLAEGAALEEVVVTAQKRTENQQDVPIAMTALTGNYIAEHNISSLQDMAGSVPGLVVTNTLNNGTAPISIRGIGGPSGGGSIFNDEPVGIYIDGVYVARLGAAVQDLVDLESIQVLRGPQGTLYGRNSTAGAVLLTTKRPTDSFEGGVTVNYDSLDTFKATGVVSGPLGSDSVLGRLAVGYGDGGNYADNIARGDEVGGAENHTVRGSLRFVPSDDVTIDLIGTYAEQESTPVMYAVASLGLAPAATLGPFSQPMYNGNPFVARGDLQQAIENDRVALDNETSTTLTSRDGTMLINWDMGPVALASISGYRKLTNEGTTDSDAQPNGASFSASTGGLHLLSNAGDQDHSEYTQELRLQSTGDNRFSWTTGLYYLHEDNDLDFVIFSYQAGPPVGAPPARPSGTTATFVATQEVDAYAAFADATYELTDAWSLTVGARYSDEKKSVDIGQTVVNSATGTCLSAAVCAPAFVGSKTFSDFSPRGVVNFKPMSDMLIYASYSQGFKSGGYNSFDASPSATAFPPEDIDAYELGLKADFIDNRLRTNLSVFKYDYTNVQIRQAVFTGGVSIRTVPEAQVKGVELETTFVPADGLLVRANVSYLDAELKRGILNAIPSSIGSVRYGAQLFPPPAAFPTEDIAGNRMTRAPQWQAFLSGEYTLAVGSLEARFGATWRYQSKVYFSETNQDTQVFVGDDWNELDLRAALASGDRTWEVALIGQNVLDDRHITQVTPFAGFPVAAVNLPARVGLQLTYRVK